MAFAYTIVLLACFLVLHLWSVTSNLLSLSPLLSPNFDDVCKEALCGKGTCKPSQIPLSPLYVNVNLIGSKLALTLMIVSSLSLAPSPIPVAGVIVEKTVATRNQPSHTRDCKEGFYNLFNVTSLPCFRDCALGMDCSKLGINVRNNSSLPPAWAYNSNNQDRIRVHGYFNWLNLISLLVAASLW